ncbi:MAG: acyltransferase [Actinomycetota bacterium]|nr:acyltransferase [Actinomycetota bacterium]
MLGATPRKSTDQAGRANGFDLVRIGAALAVVLDHSFLLVGSATPVVGVWAHRQMDLGGLAVITFFAVSGYLVAGSWLGEPRLAAFARKRALRIWPALCILLLLTTFVLGPLVSTLGVGEFLSRGETWAYLQNVTLAPLQLHLPGVFEANPYPGRVNVALWTLPIEVFCYCVLGIIGFVGLLRRPRILVATTLGVVGLAEFVVPAATRDLMLLIACFLAGSCLKVTRAPLTPRLALCAALTAVACLGTPLATVSMFGWIYLVIFTGTRKFRRLGAVTRRGDPSYGIYIYGVPIQQCLVLAGIGHPFPMAVASVVTVSIAGYASWHLVEYRALAWGRTKRPTQQPAPSYAAAATRPLGVRTKASR